VLDLAERWLLAHAPPAARRTLVHGDYRIGNVIFDARGVRAILDWELAHVGDPAEDLGWLCVRAWRFGSDALPVGGIGTREELLAAYREAGGAELDPAALRFWEAFGNFRLAVIFLNQARAFLDGKVPSVELAAIGRRVAEMESELLRVMREDAP
jgi:aminoglycoside phosphotransferase (APT) family kinase protein